MILRCRPLTALVRIAVVSALISLPMSAADVALHGRVVDENDAPVRAAKVTVRPATGSRSFDTQTDPDGAFAFTIPSPGDFLVTVEREGYYALKNQTVHVETTQEL